MSDKKEIFENIIERKFESRLEMVLLKKRYRACSIR